jgi:hypothetical protein
VKASVWHRAANVHAITGEQDEIETKFELAGSEMTKHHVILNVREIIEILQKSGLYTSHLNVVGVPLSVEGASSIRCAGDEPKADFE